MWNQLLSETSLTHIAAITGLLALTALFSIQRAFFSRRKGNTPYCPRCRYDLSAADLDATSVTCAECGRSFAPRRLIRGVRPRRRGWALSSFVLVLLTLGGVSFWCTTAAQRLQWRNYAPEIVLRLHAERAEPVALELTLQEMMARSADGGLSARGRDLIADLALTEHAAPTSQRRTALLAGALSELIARRAIDGPRLERFLDRAIELSPLRTRSTVGTNEYFAAECTTRCRIAAPLKIAFSYPGTMWIDSKRQMNRSTMVGPWPAMLGFPYPLQSVWQAPRAPKDASLEFEVEATVYRDAEVLGSRKFRSTGTLRVVPRKDAERPAAELEDSVLSAIRQGARIYYEEIRENEDSAAPRGTVAYARLTLRGNMPADAHFRVYGEIDGKLETLHPSIAAQSGYPFYETLPVSKFYDAIHLDPDFEAAQTFSLAKSIVGRRLEFRDITRFRRTQRPGSNRFQMRWLSGSPNPKPGEWRDPLTAEQKKSAPSSIWERLFGG